MTKKISLFTTAILLAGQAWAQTTYLPTVAYRNDGQQKTVYEYNTAGYMTSGKLYKKWAESGEYTLAQSATYDFHRLSTGEYVQTKMEAEDYFYTILGPVLSQRFRSSSAYDANDMQLWNQIEQFIVESGQWNLTSRTEAVLDGNGVRTGIREYNNTTGQMETVPGYTFDNKGRQTRYEGLVYDKDNGAYDVPFVYTATWGDGRLYTGYSTQVGGEGMVYQNIVPVLNEQYFDPYELRGGSSSDASVGSGVSSVLLQPAYVDDEMHHVFYSGEMVYKGNTYVQTIVQDNANNEISEVVKLGATEIQKTVYKTLANGSWSETFYQNGVMTEQYGKEYDAHGVLIREYNIEEGYTHETTYAVEYDAQGRPTKATRTSAYGNGELYTEVETYDAWIVKGTSNAVTAATINDPVLSTQYYDLQGRVMKQPQAGKIYIVKEVRQSGKVTVSKLIEN